MALLLHDERQKARGAIAPPPPDRVESRVPLGIREEVRMRTVLVMLILTIVCVGLSLSEPDVTAWSFLCMGSLIVLAPLLRRSWHTPEHPAAPVVEPLGRVEWPRG